MMRGTHQDIHTETYVSPIDAVSKQTDEWVHYDDVVELWVDRCS